MIKFFRRIRQKLLSENKFRKYLVYALGEIVLVVIGILIALQIDNWNETQKEQNLLNASLKALTINIQEDIENLNSQIAYNKKVLNAVDFTFRVISLPKYENLSISIFADSLFHIATEKTFYPNTTTFKSMETGSHFHWIKEQNLTQLIYNYYALVNKISNLTNENNQFVRNHIEGFTYNHMEFGSLMPNSNPYSKERNPNLNTTTLIRESTVLENALIGRKFRSRGEIESLKKALTKANELISSIDKYLNI